MDELDELTRGYEREKFLQAEKRMKEISAFCAHLAVFVIAMLAMLLLDIWDGDDLIGPIDWVFWPFLGWGIGILGHAWAVFGRMPHVIAKWQERKIKELMDQM